MNDTLKKRLSATLLLLASLWYAGAAMGNATLERSGSWFDPARDGEGFIVQFFSDSQAVIYWFTYNEDGTQRWFIGLGDASGDRLVVDDLQVTDGGSENFEGWTNAAGCGSLKFQGCRGL